MRKVLGLLVGLALLGPASARALDFPLHDLRIGVRGGMTVNILSEVSESDPNPVYPGFVGFGWTLGAALSYDFMDIVGVTIEFLYSSDSASGTVEFDRDVPARDEAGNPLESDSTKEESEFTLEASSLHLPIYARASIPAGVARPFLHLGVDFVFSRSGHNMTVEQRGDAPAYFDGCTPGVDCDPFPSRDFDVNPVDSSTFFLLGIGLDIDVTAVTIPIEFRWLVNPNFGNSIHDRTEPNPNPPPNNFYNDEWHYQVMVLVGGNYLIF